MCVANGSEKARGRMGARRAWRWESVEGETRRGADESRVCWDFEYQRCMGRGSFGQTDVYDKWN
jgi:hypothetical protein